MMCVIFFFFQRKTGSYLLKKGLFLVLVRLRAAETKDFVTGTRQCFTEGKCSDGVVHINSS